MIVPNTQHNNDTKLSTYQWFRTLQQWFQSILTIITPKTAFEFGGEDRVAGNVPLESQTNYPWICEVIITPKTAGEFGGEDRRRDREGGHVREGSPRDRRHGYSPTEGLRFEGYP